MPIEMSKSRCKPGTEDVFPLFRDLFIEERGETRVSIAVDGQQALDMALSQRPALIMMDMSLPVIDGWEATRQIKANDATRGIPVIALTAHAMAGGAKTAQHHG
jgi:two-component system, cell cycle response regulator DivK